MQATVKWQIPNRLVLIARLDNHIDLMGQRYLITIQIQEYIFAIKQLQI